MHLQLKSGIKTSAAENIWEGRSKKIWDYAKESTEYNYWYSFTESSKENI